MKTKSSKNPIYAGNTVWGTNPEWLMQQKAYLDKNQDKSINQVSVFKEKSGDWRWITLSSSAFRDGDNEIVSTKALYDDVLRADTNKKYGPLRWWHVSGADMGVCDFNMLYGHVLIESGTFKNEKIAKAVKNASDKLGVSIGFFHPVNEPDRDGVFHNIQRFERSLLPKEIASNPLTALVVKKKEIKNMVDDNRKIEVLRGIVGEELADEILAHANQSEKEALGRNMEFKASKKAESEEVETPDEVEEGVEEAEKETVPESEEEDEEDEEAPPSEMTDEEKCGGLTGEKPKKEKETVILKRPKKNPEEGEEQAPPAQAQPAQAQPAQAQPAQAPPKPADYQRAESEPVATRPAKAAVQVEDKAPDTPTAEPEAEQQVEKPAPAPEPAQKPEVEQADESGEYEEVEMEEVPLPEVIGNMTIEEFGELLASALSEALTPYLQTVKEAKAGLEKARLEFEVSTKEKSAKEEEVASLKEKVSFFEGALEKAAEKIATLEGDVTAVAQPYVASQAKDTILGEQDETLKSARPHESNTFVDWLAQT